MLKVNEEINFGNYNLEVGRQDEKSPLSSIKMGDKSSEDAELSQQNGQINSKEMKENEFYQDVLTEDFLPESMYLDASCLELIRHSIVMIARVAAILAYMSQVLASAGTNLKENDRLDTLSNY